MPSHLFEIWASELRSNPNHRSGDHDAASSDHKGFGCLVHQAISPSTASPGLMEGTSPIRVMTLQCLLLHADRMKTDIAVASFFMLVIAAIFAVETNDYNEQAQACIDRGKLSCSECLRLYPDALEK